MGLLGWIICAFLAFGFTFASYAALSLSLGFSGRLDKSAIIPFCLCLAFWYLTIFHAPFTISVQ